MASIQDLWSGKTSPAHSHPTKVKTLKQSLKPSVKSKQKMLMFLELKKVNGKMPDLSWAKISPLPGEFSMPNISESPREEDASILSQILLVNVPGKYYLSQKACQGILRRAAARGKELPELLKVALEMQAQSA